MSVHKCSGCKVELTEENVARHDDGAIKLDVLKRNPWCKPCDVSKQKWEEDMG